MNQTTRALFHYFLLILLILTFIFVAHDDEILQYVRESNEEQTKIEQEYIFDPVTMPDGQECFMVYNHGMRAGLYCPQ